MPIKLAALFLSAAAALSACGDTGSEQALLGGAAGTAGAAVLGGNLAAGAAVGAAGNYIYCQENPGRC